jgi:hypothetical protein
MVKIATFAYFRNFLKQLKKITKAYTQYIFLLLDEIKIQNVANVEQEY